MRLSKAIRRAAENASRMIGARIERVLLSIPSRDMMRKSLKDYGAGFFF